MSMCTIIQPPTSVLGLASFWLDNLRYFCQRWRVSDTFARSSRAKASSSLRFDGFCAAFFNCHPRLPMGFKSGDWKGHSRTDSLTTLRLTLVQVCLGITVVQLSPRFKFTTAGTTFVFKVAWYYCESKITSSSIGETAPPPCSTVGIVFRQTADPHGQAVPVLFRHSMELSPRSLQTIPKSFSHIPVDPTWASWSRVPCVMESS